MLEFDVAVIGAGPAGLAAALAAKRSGAQKVVLVERDFRMGGILEQCIHMGFGLKYFGEELSGPEYAARFIKRIEEEDITVMLDTMVLSIDGDMRVIHAVNKNGVVNIKAGSIILSMGCRERTRAQVAVPGTRPAGIFTAGTAQRFINVQNELVGKKAVIVGSGDIGMIMARRLTLEGVKVEGVVEIMPYLAGLTRNRVQCLDDYDIPLYLSHTISDIRGQYRVEGVSVARIDENREIIEGTEFDIDCDTILFSVGLIPENEVSKSAGVLLDPVTGGPIVDDHMETNISGIFACGNVLHVNDLVDNVSIESEKAGKAAALFAQGRLHEKTEAISLACGENIRYVTPQKIVRGGQDDVTIYFRVSSPERNIRIQAEADGAVLLEEKRAFVNPGEIEFITLQKENLSGINAEQLIIRTVRE
ncbi:MAG: FAD-dependent oxidoreductase [Firmicutes bacterium]|nr:FAD-dependent oxidoreductase [Bacillota bacterium]